MKTENWVNGMTVYFYGNDIDEWKKICKDVEEGKVPYITLRGVKYDLVRHGKWIWDEEGYHCSECWYHAQGNTMECIDGTFRFCPVCGARMEEEEE